LIFLLFSSIRNFYGDIAKSAGAWFMETKVYVVVPRTKSTSYHRTLPNLPLSQPFLALA